MRTYPTSLLGHAYVTLLPYLVMRTLPYLHLMRRCSANARVMRILLPESINLCPVNLPVLPPQHVEWMQKLQLRYILGPVIQVVPKLSSVRVIGALLYLIPPRDTHPNHIHLQHHGACNIDLRWLFWGMLNNLLRQSDTFAGKKVKK